MKAVFLVRYETSFGENLFLSGSLWESWERLIPMTWSESGVWSCTVTLELGDIKTPLEYKYVMVNNNENETMGMINEKNRMVWETSHNRILKLPHLSKVHALKDFSFFVVSDAWNYPLCTRVFTTKGLTPLYYITQEEEEERRERRAMRIVRAKKTRHYAVAEVRHGTERT